MVAISYLSTKEYNCFVRPHGNENSLFEPKVGNSFPVCWVTFVFNVKKLRARQLYCKMALFGEPRNNKVLIIF